MEPELAENIPRIWTRYAAYIRLGRIMMLVNGEELKLMTAILDESVEDKPYEIAKIVDTNSKKDVLCVIYDISIYLRTNLHLIVEILYDDDGNEMPVVRLDDEHKECLYEKPNVFFALMLHELGHFRNGDYQRNEGLTTADIRHKRIEDLLNGKVQDEELKADAFAVLHVGKSRMLRAFDYLINKRKKRINDLGKEIAIKEFELRKKAIQRL